MQFWIIQTLNSVAFGGLLFLLSSGFSLIFGLMRIPNLAHGAFFMLGAYFGATLAHSDVDWTIRLFGHPIVHIAFEIELNFWIAALGAGLGVGALGIVLERFFLRQLAGNEQG